MKYRVLVIGDSEAREISAATPGRAATMVIRERLGATGLLADAVRGIFEGGTWKFTGPTGICVEVTGVGGKKLRRPSRARMGLE